MSFGWTFAITHKYTCTRSLHTCVTVNERERYCSVYFVWSLNSSSWCVITRPVSVVSRATTPHIHPPAGPLCVPLMLVRLAQCTCFATVIMEVRLHRAVLWVPLKGWFMEISVGDASVTLRADTAPARYKELSVLPAFSSDPQTTAKRCRSTLILRKWLFVQSEPSAVHI